MTTSARKSTRTSTRTSGWTALHRSTPLSTKPTLPVLPTEANYAGNPGKAGRDE